MEPTETENIAADGGSEQGRAEIRRYLEKVAELKRERLQQEQDSNTGGSTDEEEASPGTGTNDEEEASPGTGTNDEEEASPSTSTNDEEEASPGTSTNDEEEASPGTSTNDEEEASPGTSTNEPYTLWQAEFKRRVEYDLEQRARQSVHHAMRDTEGALTPNADWAIRTHRRVMAIAEINMRRTWAENWVIEGGALRLAWASNPATASSHHQSQAEKYALIKEVADEMTECITGLQSSLGGCYMSDLDDLSDHGRIYNFFEELEVKQTRAVRLGRGDAHDTETLFEQEVREFCRLLELDERDGLSSSYTGIDLLNRDACHDSDDDQDTVVDFVVEETPQPQTGGAGTGDEEQQLHSFLMFMEQLTQGPLLAMGRVNAQLPVALFVMPLLERVLGLTPSLVCSHLYLLCCSVLHTAWTLAMIPVTLIIAVVFGEAAWTVCKPVKRLVVCLWRLKEDLKLFREYPPGQRAQDDIVWQ